MHNNKNSTENQSKNWKWRWKRRTTKMEKKESTEETLCSKQKMENLIKGKTQWQVKLEETDHKNEEKKIKREKVRKWRNTVQRKQREKAGKGGTWGNQSLKRKENDFLVAGCVWIEREEKKIEEEKKEEAREK